MFTKQGSRRHKRTAVKNHPCTHPSFISSVTRSERLPWAKKGVRHQHHEEKYHRVLVEEAEGPSGILKHRRQAGKEGMNLERLTGSRQPSAWNSKLENVVLVAAGEALRHLSEGRKGMFRKAAVATAWWIACKGASWSQESQQEERRSLKDLKLEFIWGIYTKLSARNCEHWRKPLGFSMVWKQDKLAKKNCDPKCQMKGGENALTYCENSLTLRHRREKWY